MTAPRLMFFVTEDWYFCSHRLPLAIAAREAGFDVVVVTRVREHGEQIRSAGIRLLSFESERRSMNPLSMFATVVRLASLYRQERPDIVHHVALKPILTGSIAARIAGIRRVVNALTGLGWLYSSDSRTASLLGFFVRRVLGMLLSHGRVIVQNPDDRAWLTSLGVKDDAIRLIRGSGVDIHRFHPHSTAYGAPVIVLVARMLRDKGVGEFVEAARCLGLRRDQARFVLVGDPDPANPASIPEATLRQWDTEGIVEWWGRRSDMAEVYAQAHIACLPSYREGLPMSLLEAAACGLPIVATDVPGCREIVLQGENGLLVPPRDSETLARALNLLIHDAGLRARMGRRGRELALAEFSAQRIIAETLALYREMLA